LEWWCCVVQCGETGSPCSAVLCWDLLGNQWARWSWLSYLWVSLNRCLSVLMSKSMSNCWFWFQSSHSWVARNVSKPGEVGLNPFCRTVLWVFQQLVDRVEVANSHFWASPTLFVLGCCVYRFDDVGVTSSGG
jgi:hypothetical protein